MSTLYIAEYSSMSMVQGPQAMPQEPPLVEQIVSIGGSSVQSSAFNAATRFVRLHCDSVCSVVFGVNPTAALTNCRMAANQTEYYGVPQGGGFQVAVIANT
jgi:hypothetical protein